MIERGSRVPPMGEGVPSVPSMIERGARVPPMVEHSVELLFERLLGPLRRRQARQILS